MLERAKSFRHRHERRLSAFAFIFGFIWDNFTLTRVDRLFDNIVLASYLLIAFTSIALINAHSVRKLPVGFLKKGADFSRFLLPFTFGGLFSSFLIFYSRSGDVLSSAPFLLMLVGLFLGNEFFRRHYQRFIFQMSIFFVTLFSYAALIIPIVLGRIGGFVFIVSGIASLVLFLIALRVIAIFAREEVEKSRYSLYTVVAAIFLIFNFLYFNNMIPPIPLSLKEIGIYHSVLRTRGGEYTVSFEKAPWYAFGKKTSAVFHQGIGEPAYVFSSVFAPARLDTEVLHRWSYFDDASKEWKSSSVVSFPISGGRNEGFRGYSTKENLFPGKWRVDVETLRGQIIGRFVFSVLPVTEIRLLTTEVR